MSNLLQARDIVKDYGNSAQPLRVLHGVSMHVVPGEFLMIVGASGAGKSTLLHILGLLDSPTTGKLLLDGRDLANAGGRERARIRNREFGFVFQFFHLLPDFNALENVMLPALIGDSWFGRRAARERAAALLGQVGLADRLRHCPSELSGGERQRAAIARAMMNSPRVLFLDEPTGNLDTRTGESVFNYLLGLNRRGQTIVMVTHNESFASRGARILHILDGRFISTPEHGNMEIR